MRRLCAGLAACAGLASFVAHASFHGFHIAEIYSNLDGSMQFVVLHESEGLDGENLLGGHQLTVTKGGEARTFTFDRHLNGPTVGGGYYGAPVVRTADSDVLIATQSLAATGLITPDYVMPDRFLPTDGATVDYAGVDEVSYTALPTDGVSALFRGGSIAANRASNFAGKSVALLASPVTAVEFFNDTLQHYFVSASAPDILALDSGRIAGWTRTGLGFKVHAAQVGAASDASPVCRFYIPPQHGDSHFFSPTPAECAAIVQKSATDPNYSGYVYESPAVFYVALPDATGACPPGTVPVYRLWNQRADSNHRYTTSAAVKAQMLAAGFVAEGTGADAVLMCAPG